MACWFRTNSGNLVTGWTSAQATVYPDNGGGVACTIAESPTGSGQGYIDIPGSGTQCSMGLVTATVTNSMGTAFAGYFYTLDLGVFSRRWDQQSPLTLEQMMLDALALWGEYGAQTTTVTETIFNADGSTRFAKTITQETQSLDSPTPNPGVTSSTSYA